MKEYVFAMSPRRVKLLSDGRITKDIKRADIEAKPPFRVFVYCTFDKNGRQSYARNMVKETESFYDWKGKVVGEYVCTEVSALTQKTPLSILSDAQISAEDYTSFLRRGGYGGLKTFTVNGFRLYDKPRRVDDYVSANGLKRAVTEVIV